VADPTEDTTQNSEAVVGSDTAGEFQATGSEELPSEQGLDTGDIEKLLDQATESLDQAAGEHVSTEAKAREFSLGDLTPDPESEERQPIELLGEVEMDLRIELGRTQMRLEEVLQLRSGSVVALDKLAGDPVDVFVNGRLIARGEVLVMNDNFCIRVTDLVGA